MSEATRPGPPGAAAAADRASLAADLRTLGVERGSRVLVHASLRRIGRVEGGAGAVAAALADVLGPEGTIVVPTATSDNSDTSRAFLARTRGMSEDERRRHLRTMPPFDPETTPSTGMGALAEHVRTSPGAVRSAHPQTSFAALHARAGHFAGGHDPGCHLGERSPLARLYDAGASVLLLGVGYESCTALHLAEYRYRHDPPTRWYGCMVLRGGRPRWWRYRDVVLDDGDFPEIGAALDRTRLVVKGRVGAAEARLLPLRQAVDFASGWMAHARTR
ncbi:aminoglycoside N(3)-acetyltransferase [Actinomadura sp. NTSP31]|uniref:aminoglycoside N(3)-acetyltransferase n=1 Tax=Actinomadura sp. NTSP31 TaxID=1735447 RepID=UPI0035BF9532